MLVQNVQLCLLPHCKLRESCMPLHHQTQYNILNAAPNRNAAPNAAKPLAATVPWGRAHPTNMLRPHITQSLAGQAAGCGSSAAIGGRATHAYALGEWFTPCFFKDSECVRYMLCYDTLQNMCHDMGVTLYGIHTCNMTPCPSLTPLLLLPMSTTGAGPRSTFCC